MTRLEAVETSITQVTPNIRISSSLTQEKVPYDLTIDREAIAGMYRDLGFSDEAIGRTRIHIMRKSPPHPLTIFGGSVAGLHIPFTGSTAIYTDWAYRGYAERMKIAQRITAGKERAWPLRIKDERKLSRGLHTKRLANYLRQAPPDRGLDFANKLLLNAANRKLNAVLLHESQHHSDIRDRNPRIWMSFGEKAVVAIGTVYAAQNIDYSPNLTNLSELNPAALNLAILAVGVVGAVKLQYKIDPMERSARSYARKASRNMAYRSLISISPKSKADSTVG